MSNDGRRAGRAVGIGCVVALAFASSAGGDDGVIEINQAKVDALGGPPFSITQAGSYILTGPLFVAGTTDSGIVISADGVTLDLNGFAITGEIVCTHTFSTITTACSGSGSGDGIRSSGTRRGITVRNGIVRGFASDGVNLSTTAQSRVEGVIAISNAADGVRVGADSVVVRSISVRNGDDGFDLESAGVIVTESVSRENNGDGVFSAGGTATIARSALTRNGQGAANGGQAEALVTVRGNAIHENRGNGVRVTQGALVADNAITDNGSYGILGTGTTSGYQNNVLAGNSSTEEVSPDPHYMCENLCDGLKWALAPSNLGEGAAACQ